MKPIETATWILAIVCLLIIIALGLLGLPLPLG